MNSVILNALTRIFFVVMLVFSIFILLRGHDEPGGGFIGGLAGAAAFAIVTMARGAHVARRWLRVHPVVLAGIGIVFGLASGVPTLIMGTAPFLTHLWWEGSVGPVELKLGTTLIFDIGVYLAVVGGMLAMIFRLYDTGEEEAGW